MYVYIQCSVSEIMAGKYFDWRQTSTIIIASYAGVFSVVTQRSSPQTPA